MPTAENTRTYTVEEAGRLLGIGRNGAYEAAKTGQLPAIRIGKRILVPKAALDRLLDGPPGANTARLFAHVGLTGRAPLVGSFRASSTSGHAAPARPRARRRVAAGGPVVTSILPGRLPAPASLGCCRAGSAGRAAGFRAFRPARLPLSKGRSIFDAVAAKVSRDTIAAGARAPEPVTRGIGVGRRVRGT